MEKVLLTQHVISDRISGGCRQHRDDYQRRERRHHRDQPASRTLAIICDAHDGIHRAPRWLVARPLKSIRCGLKCASSPIAIPPPRRPEVTGANVIRISQLEPGVSCIGQPFWNVKSPSALRFSILIGTGPLLLSVTLWTRCLPTDVSLK